jgi:hypothetical protein
VRLQLESSGSLVLGGSRTRRAGTFGEYTLVNGGVGYNIVLVHI